jgi:hypothetical protein
MSPPLLLPPHAANAAVALAQRPSRQARRSPHGRLEAGGEECKCREFMSSLIEVGCRTTQQPSGHDRNPGLAQAEAMLKER